MKQVDSNLCWAAVGFCLFTYHGYTARSQKLFVSKQGSANAKTSFNNNEVEDIDEIIGSQSKMDLLTSSDSSGSYSKSVVSKEIANDKPVIANLDQEHYVVICGKRVHDGVYQLEVMDPADKTRSWYDTYSTGGSNHKFEEVDINGVRRKVSVLYYTKQI